jgi:uncharacterized oxidoreductase
MTDLRIPADGVRAVLTLIFETAGAETNEASAIATNLVEANLAGHDSHGVVRTQRYVQWAGRGDVHFGRHIERVIDSDAFALLEGHHGFGQVLGREAVEVGLEKARTMGVSVVALRNAGHIGRIGGWAEQACDAGFVSIHFVNVKNSLLVAPFGGAGRAMSTAPVCIGVPNGDGDDFILDFATSQIAEGKALVALKSGKMAPPDALIDGKGQRTGDPRALYGDIDPRAVADPRGGEGALTAMGDHKGSGLGLACELLAGALTGSGAAGTDANIHNGMLSIYLDPACMDDGHGWSQSVAEYIAFVRSIPPAQGVDKVLIPGDPERARRIDRMANGLPLAQGVWDSIMMTGVELGLPREDLETLARKSE